MTPGESSGIQFSSTPECNLKLILVRHELIIFVISFVITWANYSSHCAPENRDSSYRQLLRPLNQLQTAILNTICFGFDCWPTLPICLFTVSSVGSLQFISGLYYDCGVMRNARIGNKHDCRKHRSDGAVPWWPPLIASFWLLFSLLSSAEDASASNG